MPDGFYELYVNPRQQDNFAGFFEFKYQSGWYRPVFTRAVHRWFRDFYGQATGHRHDIYHLVLYTRGSTSVLLNDHTCTVKAKTLYIASPQEFHSFTPSSAYTRHVEYLALFLNIYDRQRHHLRLPFCQLLSHLAEKDVPSIEFPVELPEPTFQLVHDDFIDILHLLLRNPEHKLAVTTAFLKLVDHLTEFLTCSQEGAILPEHVRAIQEYLLRHLDRPVSVAELSDLVYLTPNHLVRSFREHMGCGPIQWHIAQRLEKAKHYLIASSWRISKIAEETGFSSVYYFSRMFRQKVGLSPSEYRHQHGPG